MIWVDLDKTLVFVRNESEERTLAMLAPFYGVSSDIILRPPRKGRRILRRILVRGVEVRGCVRRGAREFLAALRKLAEVQMLTSSSRHYASAMNATFDLGFKKSHIVAREDWMCERKGRRTTEPWEGIDPAGVLVDNASDDRLHRHKLGYLGDDARLVLVEDFAGHTFDTFSKDWRRHAQEVQKCLGEKTRAETAARRHTEAIQRYLASGTKPTKGPMDLLREHEENERLHRDQQANDNSTGDDSAAE